MRLQLLHVAAALATAAAAPATATTETIEIRVPHGDLDLSRADDRARLEQRVERMVIEACEVRSPLGRGAPRTDWDCVASAKEAALAQIAPDGGDSSAMGAE